MQSHNEDSVGLQLVDSPSEQDIANKQTVEGKQPVKSTL